MPKDLEKKLSEEQIVEKDENKEKAPKMKKPAAAKLLQLDSEINIEEKSGFPMMQWGVPAPVPFQMMPQ